ncbi:MAG: pyridoxal 5'-phosphate synthase glutaminase subunit PdxT [Methanoregulaceae archaeon]
MGIRIGVLALQGNVSEHIEAFQEAASEIGYHAGSVCVFPLRKAEDIPGCDAIAIPGGESTTISRLIDKNGMRDPLRNFAGGIFATCAGMILVSSETGDPRVEPLCLFDMTVDRNAFGRQRESFECDLPVLGLDNGPFHAIFIRAPAISRAGPYIDILATTGQEIVAVRKGKHVAFAFHPELGSDRRLHIAFLRNLGF